MIYCSLLKDIRPEKSTGVPPFLLFQGLCLWRLWSDSPSFPAARFSGWLLSNWSRYSLLKAARPVRFPDKVRAGPGVSPSSSISGCAFDVSSFVSEGGDFSMMSSHSLPVTRWKPRLLAPRLPARKSVWLSCWMPSCFLYIPVGRGHGPLCHCWSRSTFLLQRPSFRGSAYSIVLSWSLTTVSLARRRNSTAGQLCSGSGRLLSGPTIALDQFLCLSTAPYI
jgi:hypothetical protein